MSKRQDRTAKLRAKHSSTGIYRRPGAGETKPHPTLWGMLDLTERRVQETLDDPDATPEAKANAKEAAERVAELRYLLAPPKGNGQLVLETWAVMVKVAVVAMAAGLMAERLFARSHEDDALHGLEVQAARVKGGEATGGARRADAHDWVPRAQALADEVWRRSPRRLGAYTVATKIARALEAETGIKRSASTIRQQLKKPENS